MIKLYLGLLTLFVLMNQLLAQDIPLYPKGIPNSKPVADEEKTEERDGITIVSKISTPTMRYFPSPKKIATGAAVIIFPGGGYSTNSISHEGYDVAKKLNEIGVDAFVVKYRIPNDKTMPDKEVGPLQDAQQAIKMVRENATSYNLDTQRIGVLGFSAGGHLASTLGTHHKDSKVSNEKNTSLRPDFMILIYPVISFKDDIGHRGSRDQLLGKNPSTDKINFYSNDQQVNHDTPPTFLVHGSDDSVVIPANSIRFYESCIRNKVKAELHIYQEGEHGFGLNNKSTKDEWFMRCKNWMDSNGWLGFEK